MRGARPVWGTGPLCYGVLWPGALFLFSIYGGARFSASGNPPAAGHRITADTIRWAGSLKFVLTSGEPGGAEWEGASGDGKLGLVGRPGQLAGSWKGQYKFARVDSGSFYVEEWCVSRTTVDEPLNVPVLGVFEKTHKGGRLGLGWNIFMDGSTPATYHSAPTDGSETTTCRSRDFKLKALLPWALPVGLPGQTSEETMEGLRAPAQYNRSAMDKPAFARELSEVLGIRTTVVGDIVFLWFPAKLASDGRYRVQVSIAKNWEADRLQLKIDLRGPSN